MRALTEIEICCRVCHDVSCCRSPRCLEIIYIVLGPLYVSCEFPWASNCSQTLEIVREEEVEGDGSEAGADYDINEIVMCQIHGSPIQYAGIEPDETGGLGEEMSHDQRLHRRAAGVERGKGAKDDGRVGEGYCVPTTMEHVVYANKPTWGSLHTVVSRGQAVDQLVPGRGTREDDLDEDPDEHHVPECA